MAQCHPRGNPRKSYHIPPLKKSFIMTQGGELPENTTTSFIVSPSCDTQILIIIPMLSLLHYSRKRLYQFLLILPYRGHQVNICGFLLPPFSEIIIINNPINTQHVKTKTNIIKSTIIYIKPINTYHLRFHNILLHSLPLHLKIH
jgi:hypothetical protein